MNIIVTKGDFGTTIKVNIMDDATEEKFNLTGCTVTGEIVKEDNSLTPITFTIADITNGIVLYKLTVDDTDTVGVCKIYIIISGATFKITSNKIVTYVVIDAYGGAV